MRPRFRPVAGALLFGFAVLSACDCGDDSSLSRLVAEIDITTRDVQFGSVPLGATKRVVLIVENTGDDVLQIQDLMVDQPFLAQVVDSTLGAGASTELEVAFRPVNDQPASGTLTIVSNAFSEPELVVNLSGVGAPGVLSVTPTTVDFEGTPVGELRSSEIVVRNSGTATVEGDLVPQRFPRPANFRMDALTSFAARGSYSVPGFGEAVFEVEYLPLDLGRDDGRLLFELTSVCGEGCGLEVEVVASGSEARVRLDPAAIDFGAVGIGSTATQQVLVQNTGNEPLTVLGVTTEGGPALEAEATRMLPHVIDGNSSVAVTLSFTPDSASEFNGALFVDTDDSVLPRARAGVLGRGEGPLFLTQPDGLNFGPQRDAVAHQRVLLLVNAGSSRVQVNGLNLSGDAEFSLGTTPGLPAILRSGETIPVTVVYRPLVIGENRGTLTVLTDDVANAQVDVPLLGGLTDRICELQVSPSRVNFGLIPPGFTRDRPVTIRNAGDDDCFLMDGDFRAPVDPSIRTSTAPWPASLAPGDSIQLNFEFAPNEPAESKANYVIQTDDPVFPERPVSLLGSSAGYADIFAQPEVLDFGPTKPSCPGRIKRVQLFNAGTVDVIVDSTTLTSSTGEFSISQGPSANESLPAGGRLAVDVEYDALDFGPDEGELEFVIRDLPFPLIVPVLGSGTAAPTVADEFEQEPVQKVDVLFVIDNSCSMGDEQAALAQNFRSFIQSANVRNVDFQIGITTTTVFGGTGGQLVGPVLDSTTPNLENEFSQQANVGVFGSGIEEGLEAMGRAINLAAAGVAPNLDLFRPATSLALIIVSDEDDQSPGSVNSYFNTIRGQATTGLTTAMITGSTRGCSSGLGNAIAAPRYVDFAALTGGIDEEICNSWASTLNNIGARAFGLQSRFVLTQPADQNSPIEVFINGARVTSGVSYDPMDNSVVFTSPPPENSTIRVTYVPDC